jgi:signal peptidase I
MMPLVKSSSGRLGRGVRRLLNAVVMVLLLTVAAALVAVVVSSTLGNRALIVRSGSMGQTAPVGSLVLVHPVSSDALRVGTIVVLQPKPTAGKVVPPTLHRAIAVKHTPQGVLVRTKGDANLVADPNPSVLGPTVLTPAHVIPWLGYLVGATRTWIGWLLLLVVPGAILFAFVLRSIWRTPQAQPVAPLPSQPETSVLRDDVILTGQSRASEPDVLRTRRLIELIEARADRSVGAIAPAVGIAVGDIILAAEQAAAAIRDEAEERLRAADEEAQVIVLRARQRADELIRKVKLLAAEQVSRQPHASVGPQSQGTLDDDRRTRADTSARV